jgi:ATP-binding cassette, subfamily C (CFTR/MRP), member 1
MCASLVTFAAFVIRSQIDESDPLSTAQAFTSLSIISLITSPALQLLASIPALTASLAAFDRVHTFLTTDGADKMPSRPPAKDENFVTAEYDKNLDKSATPAINMTPLAIQSPSPSSFTPSDQAILAMSEVYIKPSPSSQFCLQSINLTIKPGSIAIITGPIGCGKSTLLKAVMGEIPCEKGHVSLHSNEGNAYCSQTAWFQNTTIRNNICGYSGRAHLGWYQEVIHACALEEDLNIMSNGDESVVGSQGLTLSGGQKQRLALARALYSRKTF